MKYSFYASLLVAMMSVANANAQSNDGIAIHGSIQSDILVPQEDQKLGTGTYKDDVLTNTYADISLDSKYVEAGVRFEYNEHPLPGFEPGFKGWGVPHVYAKFKSNNGVDLTVGDFYDQFGSGLIFRTYEERSLGIDNAIRGARLNVSALKGVQFKFLGGVQRRYWDWDTDQMLTGTDLEINLDQYIKSLRDKNITWMIGGSYVYLDYDQNKDKTIFATGSNNRLELPMSVHAFDLRSSLQTGNYNFLAEYAWRTQDPSADNGYIYPRYA